MHVYWEIHQVSTCYAKINRVYDRDINWRKGVELLNKKRWTVVGVAVLLFVVSMLSTIGLNQEVEEEASQDQLARFLGNGATEEVLVPGNPAERILVIPVEGVIDGTEGEYSQELTLDAVEQIRNDPTIKAVLLSINSPGGTMYEIREVYDRMIEVRQEVNLPVYASMGSTAASGGYYMAMVADEIYASPETITGSIGVIMSSYNLEGLMDNLGIEANVIKSGEMKDILSSSRDMTPEEEEVLQTHVDESFNAFVEAVAEGREMPEEEVRVLADGRIFSGRQAVENNLVDQLGYKKDALQDLRDTHGLQNAQVFQLTRTTMPFDSFLQPFFGALNNLKQDSVSTVVEEIEELQGISFEYRWTGGQ